MESVLSSVPDMMTYEDAQKDVELRRARMEEATGPSRSAPLTRLSVPKKSRYILPDR